MPDLEERFRSLDRTIAPELWADIASRPPRPLPPPPRGRRLVAGITALIVAVAGFVVAVAAFRDTSPAPDRSPQPPADESPRSTMVTNGWIAVARGPDQDIVLLDPETGVSRPLVDRHGADQPGGLEMAWSPDGSRLAYTDYRDRGDFFGLFVLDVATGDVRDLTQGLVEADSPAWSPDGTQIAFTGFGGAIGYEIYVVAPDGSGLRRVTDRPDNGVDGAYMPSWSPDGGRIAFRWNHYEAATESESSGIAVVELETNVETIVTETPAVDESPAWSPDGTRIAFLRKVTGVEEVLVANADGSGEWSIMRDDVEPIPMSIPSWSPDGSRVLFGAHIDDNWGIWLANADGMNARPVLEDAYAAGPVWAPDGSLIAFVGDDAGRALPRAAIRLMRPDGSDDRNVAAMESVSEIAWQPLPAVHTDPSPDAVPPVPVSNGPILFQHLGDDGTRTPPGRIESVEPDGSDRHTVFEDEPMPITQIAWSPDGSRIAYRNPVPAERGIYVANADGTDPVRLTDGANDGRPSWSPDETRIVFASSRYDPAIEFCDGLPGQEFLCPTDLYTMDADGSNVVRLTRDHAPEFQPVWSPDGTRIVYVRTVGGTGTRVFSINPDGTDERPVSSGNGGSDFSPTWSSDGTRIAFVGFRWEDWNVWVVDADGSDEHEIDTTAEFGAWWDNRPQWSPDGALLAFVCLQSVDGPVAELCLMHPDGSGLERIAEVPWSAGDIAWQALPTESDLDPVDEVSPPPAVPDATVGETIDVGQSSALTVGAGSVGVAGFDVEPEYRPFVIRIDEGSGQVLARIPVDGIPDSTLTGGGGMAFDGRFLWIVGTALRAALPWTRTSAKRTSCIASKNCAFMASMSISSRRYVAKRIRSRTTAASASHVPTCATRSFADQPSSK